MTSSSSSSAAPLSSSSHRAIFLRILFSSYLYTRTLVVHTRAATFLQHQSLSNPSFVHHHQHHPTSRLSQLPYYYRRQASQHLSCSTISTTATNASSTTTFDEEDQIRWEQMYNVGSGTECDLNPSKGSVRTSVHAIRVVTLDLDNTLWKTSATIDAANDALAEFLSMKLEQTKMIRVEHVMGKLYQANEKRYAPLQINNLVKGPVLLTLLRKDAIRYTLTNHNESGLVDNDQSIENIVEEAFLVWRDARHQSIPLHFAKAVVECLQEIRSLPTKDNATKIIVGAVTDGNSDPFAIQDISTYFDFCINAESIGIGKPDKRIYLQAVAQALQHPTSSLQDLIPTSLALTSMDQFSEQQLEDLIGPWWVHIGDDFVKDCVAAKNLNMRTIWTRELVQDKIIKEDTWKRAAESSKSKRNDIQSFVHKVSNSAVVEMAVGADDYLANSLKEEFADAVLDEFRCVAMVLRQWQEEALTSSSSFVTQTKDSTKDDPPEFLESIDQTTNLEKLEGAIHFDVEDSKSSTTTETKFCIFCGTKLPVIAKFCFSCGKEQQ